MYKSTFPPKPPENHPILPRLRCDRGGPSTERYAIFVSMRYQYCGPPHAHASEYGQFVVLITSTSKNVVPIQPKLSSLPVPRYRYLRIPSARAPLYQLNVQVSPRKPYPSAHPLGTRLGAFVPLDGSLCGARAGARDSWVFPVGYIY